MKTLDRKWVTHRLADVSWGLNALHLFVSFLYMEPRILPLVAINIGCALAGGVGLWLLRKGHFRAHILTLYLSELLVLSISVVCQGWNTGFQLPLIGLTALVFLCEYLGRSFEIPYIPALPLGIINFAVYGLIFLFRFQQPGLLFVPQSVAATVEILWGVLVFAFLVGGLYLVVRLSSDSERSLTDKAETDELTGLYNRAGYDRLCVETALHTTTLLLVDTDKFKGINDRFGHETGDRVLKKISAELKRNFRSVDCVCRIGGDEFAVLMVNTETLEEELISAKINRINRELSHTVDNKLPYVSISVGAAHGSEAEDWTALFKQADSVLYRVKAEGGRGCRFYRPE